MIQRFLPVLLLLLSVFVGCKDTNSTETNTNTDPDIISTDSIAVLAPTTVTVYAWVDKLRMRSEPDTNG